jgi:hypothetical protein
MLSGNEIKYEIIVVDGVFNWPTCNACMQNSCVRFSAIYNILIMHERLNCNFVKWQILPGCNGLYEAPLFCTVSRGEAKCYWFCLLLSHMISRLSSAKESALGYNAHSALYTLFFPKWHQWQWTRIGGPFRTSNQGRNLRGLRGCDTPPPKKIYESSGLAGQSKILNDRM